MSNGIASKFSLLVNGDIEVYTEQSLKENYDFVESSDTVTSVTGLIYGKESTQISNLKAVESSYFNEKRLNSLHLETIENTTNLPSIIISRELSENLNLKIGDKAALILAKDENKIRPKLVFIQGIYDSGYKEIDLNISYMYLSDLQAIYGQDLFLHQEILLKDGTEINDALLEFNLDGYFSRAWYEIQVSAYNNLLVSTQSLLVVFIVIALLTGYFISSISSDLITKDHKSIATNKLLGLKNKVLVKNYFIAIELFTVLSTTIGIILGIITSKVFLKLISNLSLNKIQSLSWYLFDFDLIIPYQNIFLIAASLIFISVISVYLSLRRIKRIEVLDLLIHE
jgi:lipoprotein-releasing system permease protein